MLLLKIEVDSLLDIVHIWNFEKLVQVLTIELPWETCPFIKHLQINVRVTKFKGTEINKCHGKFVLVSLLVFN